MPKVTFVTDHLEVEVVKDASIQDIVAESGATLPFGCRLGSCGTCRVLVEEGMENLNPKTERELELFKTFTCVQDNERLGCQLKVFGDVKIKS